MQTVQDLIVARPWLLAIWVFVIGSAIGSFLNVVIYRLPRGMSLSRPGSRCPCCGHAIRWYHNLPIVGWLLLRGRCYDCRARISPRYPLVEFAVAALFLGLAYVDVYRPIVADWDAQTAPEVRGAVLGQAALAFAAHAWLACCVLAAALVRWDRKGVPWSLGLTSLVITAVAAPFLDTARALAVMALAAILLLLIVAGRGKATASKS